MKTIQKKYITQLGNTIYVKNAIAEQYYNKKSFNFKAWIFHKDLEKMVKFIGNLEEYDPFVD
jgi:hypothetical protein